MATGWASEELRQVAKEVKTLSSWVEKSATAPSPQANTPKPSTPPSSDSSDRQS